MKKAIFFDLDNTLIETEKLYDDARDSLVAYVATFGFDAAEVEAFERKHDVELVNTINPATQQKWLYTKGRYPQTFMDTLLHFRPDATEEEIFHAKALGEAVFTKVAAVKAGVAEAIDLLEPHYDLYLVTKGEKEVQEKRVQDFPYRDDFKQVFIVPTKNAHVLKEIAGSLNLDPSDITFIGDSISSDVNPAREAGMNAVLIEAHNWAAHEQAGHNLKEGTPTVTNLLEVVTKGLLPIGTFTCKIFSENAQAAQSITK